MNRTKLIDFASFSPNLLQSPSGWLGHLPFAGWVIQEVAPKLFVELGTHYGHSYFSFCQSVAESAISTKCYAVDTWQGDDHAGLYSDEIFNGVNSYNLNHYSNFSHLLRMTFDQALTHFEDRSIELLHIDGFHSYEAVRHDFETWLPKLAPGALVMFHDTQVRKNDFGVWRYWEELKLQFPNSLEFKHSNGLGVLQLNDAPELKKKDWLKPNAEEAELLVKYFTAIGTRQMERFDLDYLQRKAASFEQVQSQLETQVQSLSSALADSKHQIDSIYKSRSWRATGLLRWVGNTLRSAKRGLNFIGLI